MSGLAMRRTYRDRIEAEKAGRDPLVVTRHEHDRIGLALERFGFGWEFRSMANPWAS